MLANICLNLAGVFISVVVHHYVTRSLQAATLSRHPEVGGAPHHSSVNEHRRTGGRFGTHAKKDGC